MTWECQECGSRFPDQSEVLGGWCPSCVPSRRDVRELIHEWREASERDADKGYTHGAGTWAVAAKELEELIDG